MTSLAQWLQDNQESITKHLANRLGSPSVARALTDTLSRASEDNLAELQHMLENWLKQLPAKQSSLLYVTLLLEVQADLQTLIQAQHSPEGALTLQNELQQLFTPMIIGAAKYESEAHAQHLQGELDKIKRDKTRLEKHKADFISVAAHELKTPLTLIEGYANMLKTDLPSEEYPRTEAMLRGIVNGTQRLREIIEDMIDVTLIEMGVMELNPQPVHVPTLLNILVTELRKPADERKITLVFDENNFPDKHINADPERMFQVLIKILENAIKYTPDNGKIYIAGEVNGDTLDIRIKDTGIGIDEHDHSVIFEKFFSLGQVGLHSSSKSKFKGGGPGLGLAIARGIVESHHGKVWVESTGYDEKKMPGSCFHVQLPTLSAEAVPDATHTSEELLDQYNAQLPEPSNLAYSVENNRH